MPAQWAPLSTYLTNLGLQPGETTTLSLDELRRILGVATLPDVVGRVANWDPIMGRTNGGLQHVLNRAQMIPVAFGWSGDHARRPKLTGVVLQKWALASPE
jgi:hypothetical protein